MKTLVIYDYTGYIYMTMGLTYIKPKGGIQYMEIEIPEGKILQSIDTSVTPHVPVYTDMSTNDLASENAMLIYKLMMGGLA